MEFLIIAVITATVILVAAQLPALIVLAGCLHFFRTRWPAPDSPETRELPRIVVQIPACNEGQLVIRALTAAAALDWPRDRLEIQLLDNSTDETTGIAQEEAARLAADGFDAVLLHRDTNEGYKAGNLLMGLAETDAPFVAILDADFVPDPGWLKRSIGPLLADPHVAFVQTQVDFQNRDRTWVTRGQTMILDPHAIIEQTGRAHLGWLFPFNGSGGIWRRAAIDDAGGWRTGTLLEDFDLTFRAYRRGWRGCYLPDVVVHGELPETLAAWTGQQTSWNTGAAQTLGREWRALLRGRSTWRTSMALGEYFAGIATQTLLLPALLLLAAAVIFADRPMPAALLWAAVAIYLVLLLRLFILPLVSQVLTGRFSPGRFALDFVYGIGLQIIAAFVALRGYYRGFSGRNRIRKRTPKSGGN